MGFKEMCGEKVFYTCDKCRSEFQFGPHIYDGSYHAGSMLCKGCRPNKMNTIEVGSPEYQAIEAAIKRMH